MMIISSEYNDWISKRNWCTIKEPELTITVVRFNVILDSKNLVTYPLRKGYFHSFFDSHLFDSKLNSSTSSVWWLAMQKIKDWLQCMTIAWQKVHTREGKWAIFIDWEYPNPVIMATINSYFAYRVFNSPCFARMVTLLTKTKPYFISHHITTCMFERFS